MSSNVVRIHACIRVNGTMNAMFEYVMLLRLTIGRFNTFGTTIS